MLEFEENVSEEKLIDGEKTYSVLRAVFSITPKITFVKNTEFIYIAASELFAKSIGKESSSEIVGKTDFEIFEPDLAQKHRKEDTWILSNRENMENILEEFHEADGNIRYDSVSKYCLCDENGKVLGVYGIQYDVTQDVLAQQQYEKEIQYLLRIGEDASAAYLIDVDEWEIIHEKRLPSSSDDPEDEADIQRFCRNALSGVYSSDSEAYHFYENFNPDNIKSIYLGGKRDIVMEYQRRLKKEVHWIQDQIKLIKNPKNGHLFLSFIINDIQEKKQKEQELIRRAETDGLTGLLNREAFLKKVHNVLTKEDYYTNHALFMLDVDNFKKLNDTQGHQIGDKFLVEMASAIKSCFRNTDIVGRLGGDEFLVLMRNTPSQKITEKNAKELLKNISQVCLGYETEDLSLSIGVSTFPQDGTNFDELYEQADKALYSAKRHGKSRYEFASLQETI